MRVDWIEYGSTLRKFLNHIESVDVINEYIIDCGKPKYDIKHEVVEVLNSHGQAYFDIGETPKEEVANIYGILAFCCDNNINIPQRLARSYSSSTKYQDKVKSFNDRVVMILIRHIEVYLTKIGIDMGIDEQTKFSITVNNGQVNLASENSTINAVQNNSVDIKELESLINTVRNKISSELSEEDIVIVEENLEVFESELKSSNPRKSLLKTAITSLSVIKSTAEFGAAVSTLIQFIGNFIK